MLRFIVLVSLSIVYILSCFEPLLAIVITNPVSNAEIHPGETVTLKAVPSNGENLRLVTFFISGKRCEPSSKSMTVIAAPYEVQCTISKDETPGTMRIEASGSLPGDDLVEAEVSVKVVLPPGLILKGLKLMGDRQALFFSKVGSTKHIGVIGIFSDNTERFVDGAMAGTIFESSDPTTATVSANGDVQAKKNGNAFILIKNGNQQLKVKVVIKAEP